MSVNPEQIEESWFTEPVFVDHYRGYDFFSCDAYYYYPYHELGPRWIWTQEYWGTKEGQTALVCTSLSSARNERDKEARR